MGTNYYLHNPKPCPTCGHDPNDPKHIGKSSCGWVFALHVYPESGIHDLDDWERVWTEGRIRDEYGRDVSIEDMRLVIMARARPERWDETPYMYISWEQFHQQNHSENGPVGLLRTNMARDARCVKHGAGTWDCFTGEFS